MSYSTPSGPQRKPGENLSAQGKPEKTSDDSAPNAGPVRRSAGAPKRSAGAPQRPGGKPGGKPPGKGGTSNKGGTQGKSGVPGGKKNRSGHKGRPAAAVKAAQGRGWGNIAIFAAAGLIVVGIIGYSGWQAVQGSKTWKEKLTSISGVVDYTKSKATELAAGNGNHVPGRVTYFATPSVGGNHNARWQNCMGDVYPEQIATEHATHSLEHGAVWITYDPTKITGDAVRTLEAKVKGTEYMMLSPFPGQSKPISLQAWGYQLTVDSPDDERIDEFIKGARVNASVEPGAVCSGGVTATGVEPQAIPKQPATDTPASEAPIPVPPASPSAR